MIRRGAIRVNQIGGGVGANPAQGATVWNPGAAPGEGYVTTWAEVMESFAETTGEFTVFLDDAGGGAFSIPAGTYELDSRLAFARPAPAVGQLTVSLADGAILRNLAGVYRNITVETNATATTALQFDDGRALELDLGAVLDNQGTQPAIVVVAGETIALGFYRASRADATTAAIVDLEAGSMLTATFQSGSQASTDWASGTPTSTLIYLADSTYDDVTLSAAPGTVTTTRTASYANISGTPPTWTTLYELDFETLANQALLADGVHAIAGKNWTAINQAALTQREIINGTGLKFTTTAVGTQLRAGARTAGLLYVPLSTLLSTFDAAVQKIRIMCQATFSSGGGLNNTYSGALSGVLSYNAATNMQVMWGGFADYNPGGARITTCAIHNGADTLADQGARGGADCMRVIAEDQKLRVEYGTYAADWPATWQPAVLWRYNITQWGTPFRATTQDAAVFLCVTNGNSAAAVTGTIQKLRVDVENT